MTDSHWSLEHPLAILIAVSGIAGGIMGARISPLFAIYGTFAGIGITLALASMGDEDVPPALGPHH
jgi:hypothetical protein